jgi:lambda repressor-like predicted transcriptional regulator
MFDRKRLDPFSWKEFLTEADEIADFEEAGRIQQAGVSLRQMREQAGLSVEQLAGLLRRPPDELARIERGQLLDRPPENLMLQIREICGMAIKKQQHIVG